MTDGTSSVANAPEVVQANGSAAQVAAESVVTSIPGKKGAAAEAPGPAQPIWLVANPNAGRKAGIATNDFEPEAAQHLLEGHGIPVTMRLTERAGHGTELAREAVAAGARTVIAAGGDGTVREVATGLLRTPVTLGILPLGSIMNIARSLNIPRELEGAAEVIRAGNTVHMDVGWAKTSRKEMLFLEAAGVGVDAGIFRYANQLDHGHWSSIVPLIRFLFRYRPQRLQLTVDGRPAYIRSCYTVTVAVGPYTGAALTLAPDAKVDDRQFDIVVREGFRKMEYLLHLTHIAWGRREHTAKERTFKGRTVEIDRSTRAMLVHADGEELGSTPVHFELQPAALRVYAALPPPGNPSAVEHVRLDPARTT